MEVLGMKGAGRNISEYDLGCGKIIIGNYHSGLEQKNSEKRKVMIFQ